MQPARFDDEKSGVTRRREILGASRPSELGDVVRDAMTHAEVIARDTVSLGRLEIDGVIAKAKSEAYEVLDYAKAEARTLAARARVEAEDALPRFAFGAIAAVIGVFGVIFLGIAAFLGLGYFVPSLAARFTIFAMVFLITSAIAAAHAGKNRGVPANRRPADPRLRHIAAIHPGDPI
jgi:hypothetical protein